MACPKIELCVNILSSKEMKIKKDLFDILSLPLPPCMMVSRELQTACCWGHYYYIELIFNFLVKSLILEERWHKREVVMRKSIKWNASTWEKLFPLAIFFFHVVSFITISTTFDIVTHAISNTWCNYIVSNENKIMSDTYSFCHFNWNLFNLHEFSCQVTNMVLKMGTHFQKGMTYIVDIRTTTSS